MIIQYMYGIAGQVFEGQVQTDDAITDGNQLVIAALQAISNRVGEYIAFSILDPSGTREIGTNFVEPDAPADETKRSIESVELSFNGSSWKKICIITS